MPPWCSFLFCVFSSVAIFCIIVHCTTYPISTEEKCFIQSTTSFSLSRCIHIFFLLIFRYFFFLVKLPDCLLCSFPRTDTFFFLHFHVFGLHYCDDMFHVEFIQYSIQNVFLIEIDVIMFISLVNVYWDTKDVAWELNMKQVVLAEKIDFKMWL